MAKKQEFKPDKPQSNWLSKLYLTALQRKSISRWALYGLVLLVLSVVQDVILCRFRLFGATTELVPCGIFLICVLVGTEQGSLFALISSVLYLFSGTAPGPYSMVFITALAVFLCIFRQAYLQKGFSAAMLCTTVGMFLYEGAIFAFGLFLGLTTPSRITGFCITAALSLVAAPILYPITLSIGSIGGETWKE